MIRQDWLDAQGLEKPVTYDALHEVLTAFKNAYGATLWLTSYGGVPGDFSGGYGFPEYSGGVAAPLYWDRPVSSSTMHGWRKLRLCIRHTMRKSKI